MVRFPLNDCEGPVKLFGKYQSNKLMRKGHRRNGEFSVTCPLIETVGPTNVESHIALAGVHTFSIRPQIQPMYELSRALEQYALLVVFHLGKYHITFLLQLQLNRHRFGIFEFRKDFKVKPAVTAKPFCVIIEPLGNVFFTCLSYCYKSYFHWQNGKDFMVSC